MQQCDHVRAHKHTRDNIDVKRMLPRRSEDPCHSLEIFGSVPRIFSVFFLYRHHLRKASLFDRWTLLQTPLPLVPRPLPGHKQTD